jgi:hypothetical protein
MIPRSALLWWYAGGILAAIAIGWIAAQLNVAGIAPLGVLSFCVGALLGIALGAIAASQRLAARWPIAMGTIVLAFVTILAEHAWLYREFRRQWYDARAKSAEIALFRAEQPWSPGEYFGRELSAGRSALWALDAVLIIAAALTVFIVVRRRWQ